MPNVGQSSPSLIVNRSTGERILILTTGEETGGRLLAFEVQLEPGGRGPIPHRHPEQEERFTVLEGRLRMRAGLHSHLLGVGETTTIRSGVPHSFYNPGPGECRARVEVRPSLRMGELLESSASLGVPGPVALAKFLSDYGREVRAPILPRTVAAGARVLVWLASRRRDAAGQSAAS